MSAFLSHVSLSPVFLNSKRLCRWDRNSYSERSVEDLKERYYSIAEKLERVHGGATAPDQVPGTTISWNVVPQPRNVVPQLTNVRN